VCVDVYIYFPIIIKVKGNKLKGYLDLLLSIDIQILEIPICQKLGT